MVAQKTPQSHLKRYKCHCKMTFWVENCMSYFNLMIWKDWNASMLASVRLHLDALAVMRVISVLIWCYASERRGREVKEKHWGGTTQQPHTIHSLNSPVNVPLTRLYTHCLLLWLVVISTMILHNAVIEVVLVSRETPESAGNWDHPVVLLRTPTHIHIQGCNVEP